MKKQVMVALIGLFFIATAQAQVMDTQVGENIVDSKSVLSDDWASITVSPSTAYSLPNVRNFTQLVTVCNKADDEGYLYFDAFFDKPLKSYTVTRWDKWTDYNTIEVQNVSCENVGNPPDNQTVCTPNGTYNTTQALWKEQKTPMPAFDIENWGQKANYVKKAGELFNGKECKDYLLNYQTVWGDNEGKWNFQVWGNIVDDWTCIQDGKCAYSYTLDPTYSTAFSYKKQINITNNGAGVNNYTLSLNFTSSTLDTTHLQADGDDAIFVNFDETAQLGCFKESFDAAGVMNWSVLIPNFTNTTATTVWMYYGNSTLANQCPEGNDAYLLYDDMNSSGVNTTIWNQFVGNTWTTGVTTGGYTASVSAASFCVLFGSSNNGLQCALFANNSGKLRSSQSTETLATLNVAAGTACGFEFGAGNYTGGNKNNTFGTVNITYLSQNNYATEAFYQNATALAPTGTAATHTTIQNYTFRNAHQNQAVWEWVNNTGNGNAQSIFLSSRQDNIFFLNQTQMVGVAITDGSGASACTNALNVFDYRMRSYVNATPTYSLGSEVNVSNPAIALNITNETWETTGVLDSGGISNYSINVTIDQNAYNNISQVNFSINGVVYRDSQIQNQSGGVGQTNWTRFNISVYSPMVQSNATSISFNWSFTQQSNSTANTTNSSNRTQTVSWGSWVNNFTYVSPIQTGAMNNILVNFTKYTGNPVGIYRNTTLEWNQSNRTTVGLITNATGYEDWNFSFTTPAVYVSTNVQMKGWLNISFNGSYVTRDPNATQVLVPISVNGTQTWEDPVYEVGLANYSINLTWNANDVNNISNVNFTYNNTLFIGGITNTSGYVSGNINWTNFQIQLRPNLTQTNASKYNFTWNFTVNTNASNISTSATTQNQTILFAFYPNNVTYTSPQVELLSNSFTINVTAAICELGLPVFPTATATIEYNGTNRSAVTPLIVVGCPTNRTFNAMTMTAPGVTGDTYVPLKVWANFTIFGIQMNRNGSNTTQLVVDDGSINNETYNTPIFETSLANFSINVTNSSVTITNVNFTWNATQYNGSDITNTSVGTTTRFNITVRVPLVPGNQSNYSFRWNYTISTGDNKSSNLTNQTVLWAWYPNKLDLTPDLYELFPQTAGVNVTKHLFVNGVVDSVNIEYNQSNQSTSLTSNQTNWEDWNVTFITPAVSSDLSVQARGILNVSFLGTTYLRNTTNASQLIRNINLSCGKCFNTTSNFTAVLNFSFFDEFSNASLRENGSDSITIWTTLQSVNQTFGCNFNNVTFHELCVQNMNTNFTANFNVQYGTNSSNTYPIRELWKRNQQIANQTMNYSLYNLLSLNASEVVINVQDAARVALQNEIVEAYKYNISNNSFMLVDSGFTDFDGKTRLQLYRQDDYYKFVVRDGSGASVLETSMFKLLFTEYFLVLSPINQTTIGSIIQIRQIERNITWDNGTKLFALSYLDRNNVSDNYCMTVINTSNFNNTILNKQCSSNHSASFSYSLGNVNGTYIATFTVGSNSVLVDMVEAILNVFRTLGKDAYFGSFILVGTISAAGFFVNPSVGFALLAFGMTSLKLMNLITMSWYAFSSILAVIIMVGLIVRKSL